MIQYLTDLMRLRLADETGMKINKSRVTDSNYILGPNILGCTWDKDIIQYSAEIYEIGFGRLHGAMVQKFIANWHSIRQHIIPSAQLLYNLGTRFECCMPLTYVPVQAIADHRRRMNLQRKDRDPKFSIHGVNIHKLCISDGHQGYTVREMKLYCKRNQCAVLKWASKAKLKHILLEFLLANGVSERYKQLVFNSQSK